MDAEGLNTRESGLEPVRGRSPEADGAEGPEPLIADLAPLTADEYTAAHGEALSETLDLSTWQPGADLSEMYARLEREVGEAVRKESEYQQQIRGSVFPLLRTRQGAPPCAGVFSVTIERLEDVHRKVLFNGAVEACDGTVASLDTLPMTITQIGVCLVSYRGNQGSWVHRIFRRDLRTSSRSDPIEETMDLLNRRRRPLRRT